ncbi:MAG TPA: TlpA disulfide reductase family protein [Fimbriimonadaceae bacterium]|nr:TlpA disulfide reductase family protein [Fimbriimonadaceae bacterium]
MKSAAILAALALCSALATADQVSLTPVTSGGMRMMGGYMPQRLQLSKDKPEGLKHAPETKNPMYGVLEIGGGKHIVILDDDGAGQKLYVDTNGNGDLTDDAPLEWTSSPYPADTKQYKMYKGTMQVNIPIGGKDLTVSLGCYKFDKADSNRAQLANTLLYYSDYAAEGQITLSGKSCKVLLADYAATGFRPNSPSTGDKPQDSGVHLLIDVNGNGRFDNRGENYDVSKPFNIGGTTYEISGLSGTAFTIGKSSQTVAEILPPPDLSAGKKAIPFNMKTTSGEQVSFPSSYKGKLVMLDFWATWCGPCKGEIPGLAKAYEKYHSQGFDVLGISLDNEDTAKGLTQFTKDWNMPWPQVCDAKYWDAEVAKLYVVQSIPAAFLVDGDTGEVLASGNELRGDQLVPTLEKALAKKHGAGK